MNESFSYPINRWCGDQQDSDLTETSSTTRKASLTEPISTRPLTNFLITIKNSPQTLVNSTLTPMIYVFFTSPYGSSPVIYLNELTNRSDIFQSTNTDEFTFTIPDTGLVISNFSFLFSTQKEKFHSQIYCVFGIRKIQHHGHVNILI